MSAAPRDGVLDYLERRGEPRALMEWKYFDDAFNRGRERGYVWMRDGKPAGFLGVIPFELGRGAVRRRAAWSCDWSVASDAPSAGMGVMVLKEAQKQTRVLCTFDGNDNTKKMLPRLATRGVDDAGLTWWCPLRFGPAWDKLRARVPVAALQRPLTLLRQVPIRRRRRSARAVETCAGVAPALSALACEASSAWRPLYDHAFLEWQLVRSPNLVSASVWIPGTGETAEAGALVWRSRFSRETWRVASWVKEGSDDALTQVLIAAVDEIRARGGAMVATVATQRDARLTSALSTAGFRPGRVAMPFWLSLAPGEEDVADLLGIDYLATDLAYRM